MGLIGELGPSVSQIPVGYRTNVRVSKIGVPKIDTRKDGSYHTDTNKKDSQFKETAIVVPTRRSSKPALYQRQTPLKEPHTPIKGAFDGALSPF